MIRTSIERRQRRHRRVRKRVAGSPERPRLNVFRSSQHIYAQVILDGGGQTLAQASTLDGELKDLETSTKSVAAAHRVGQVLAQRALAQGITRVVFDRGGYLYHGRVKALAEGAREGGLEF